MTAAPRSRSLRLVPAGAALVCVLSLAACGSAHATRQPQAHKAAEASEPSTVDCAAAVPEALASVAGRIYHTAGHGVVVGQATHRIESSAALAQAIRAGDARGAERTLKTLLVGQIARVQIEQGGRVLAKAGSGQAIAPVSGSIPGTSARFTLSTQPDRSYLQVTQQVTGAELLLLENGQRRGGTLTGPAPRGLSTENVVPLSYAGHDYQAIALRATSYPKGALQIALLVPVNQIACHSNEPAVVRVEALGGVAERIYREERESPYTKSVLRRVETSRRFIDAVAKRDVQATRAAIISFFASHIHVVRVRVTVSTPSGAQRLFYDLGGPHVLAPVPGVLRSGGRVVGHFVMAIQDDAGYLKLARKFTGAEVLMRTPQGQVEGSLRPGPKTVPDRGQVQYAGSTYRAYSFIGEAFPSGPLRISLLQR